ncbi:hypothetical protein CAPTEDRAFT_165852 [Capitella teleta]|uniref:Sulfatase N-terminal domain-containing protein n=1 Tax=Capitella teleta TaxID=283909 RepID=R7TGT0_CAPTE|nr:hypothetical protein CAPTEDRAFT_165852 [Capitella teleta]|eukprot:ELT92899.1 hypothetical protein CAPTEDRAFT_165852 [Capitella teleta]
MHASLASIWWGLMAMFTNNVKVPVAQKPNILLILADDLGWNDVGWNNPEIKTPNLDRLASNGVILNASYALSTCSPSRTALLTGRYPFKLGLQHGVVKKGKPYGLPLNITLLPQKLKHLGYSTHAIGKWHLGFCRWEYTPTFRGFDSFYGFYSGSEDYYKRKTAAIRGYDFRMNTKVFKPKIKKYSTLDYGRRAVKIIQAHKRTEPLFLYMPFQAVHSPLQVPKSFEFKYRNIVDRNRRIFSGMVSAMDSAIGMTIKALKQRNMLTNTMIVFLSDNGGTPFFGGNNWPLRGSKATLWEGGTRVPSFVWGKMLLQKAGYTSNEMIHAVDWFPTLVSLAGGTPEKDVDGVDQWQMLSQRQPSRRKEFVYGINSITGRAAIRRGKYKLIEGTAGHYSGWYPAPSSRVVKMKRMKQLNKRHVNSTLLYNIQVDPIESNDLSAKYPHLTQFMLRRLNRYKAQEVEAFNPRKERYSQPKFWGGNWSPGWC